ncbi:MAG: hypothetical protein IT424_01930 [Pirellulales bacterium]|nr:hypothetical protein [Pirellulales bacterium]
MKLARDCATIRSGPMVLAASLLAAHCGAVAAETLPLLYADDFERGMQRWQTTDPNPAKPYWKIVDLKNAAGEPTKALRVTGMSDYQPPHRSPPSIALLKDVVVGDFDITAQVQSTNVDAGAHRDMCIFWGYQDPAHFYYVHFGAKSDPHACQIFIVNDAPRTAITEQGADGTPWTEDWHKVKIVRRIGDGTIEAYFDDMQKPMMTAHDNAFTWGRVGLGTFDDNGNWDDFELRGAAIGDNEIKRLKESARESRQ